MYPIAYFLIPYGILLLLFLFFTFVDLWHLVGFGKATGIVGFIATFIFLAGAVLLLNESYKYIIDIDWEYTMNVLDSVPSFNAPSFIE
jgi:hypothetical protein